MFDYVLLATKLDPIVGLISVLAILAIAIGLFLKKIRQPYIIGYIVVGAILGEHGLGFIKNAETIHHLGEIGIILLLFFIGMEISLPELIKQWKIAAVGTLMQVGISVGIILTIGYFFNWRMERSILIGFVIALSSSAVIIKLLQDKNRIDTRIGKNVLSILLMQDIIIVPLLIITSFLGGTSEPFGNIVLMIIGGILIMATLIYIYVKRAISFPFAKRIEHGLATKKWTIR
ncbi:cation:proton antiporter domain-containing protein [Maribacter arcticus]|uniref:Sodium/hydrogen exchanger family protein n=1 Tax=Maribacter arcticus TaxID=561365 RepID=A0A1T5CI27_9FLAO|nr:cation:proton antiporter [Maribacter arcticus]SKB59142.1 Sodium/hydrogen exchanger family protein [Maribacter arcticus]